MARASACTAAGCVSPATTTDRPAWAFRSFATAADERAPASASRSPPAGAPATPSAAGERVGERVDVARPCTRTAMVGVRAGHRSARLNRIEPIQLVLGRARGAGATRSPSRSGPRPDRSRGSRRRATRRRRPCRSGRAPAPPARRPAPCRRPDPTGASAPAGTCASSVAICSSSDGDEIGSVRMRRPAPPDVRCGPRASDSAVGEVAPGLDVAAVDDRARPVRIVERRGPTPGPSTSVAPRLAGCSGLPSSFVGRPMWFSASSGMPTPPCGMAVAKNSGRPGMISSGCRTYGHELLVGLPRAGADAGQGQRGAHQLQEAGGGRPGR